MRGKRVRKEAFCLVLFIAVFGLVAAGLLMQAPLALAKENKIRLLGVLSMTGPAAFYGVGVDKGVKLALKEIEARGIKGFSGVEWRVIDTETKPSTTERKLKRELPLFKPHVAPMVGTESELRVLCVNMPKEKVPAPVGGHLGMNKYMGEGSVPVSQWIMYYGFADYFIGQIAGEFFHKKGAKKVALIAGDYDWGYSNGMGLKRYWEKNGHPFEIVAVIYTPLDKTDYSTEVQIIKDLKPDAIFSPFCGAGWWSLGKQLKEGGAFPEILLHCVGYSSLGSAKLSGEFGAEGVYAVNDHDPTSQVWADFIKRWKAEYGEQAYPEPYAENYYELTGWIIKALEEVGPDKINDKDYVADTMLKTSYQNILVSPMGPLCPYGSNWGAKAAVVQYVKGSSPIDPSFGLHGEVREIIATPKMDIKQILEEMGAMTRLEPGEKYPMGQ